MQQSLHASHHLIVLENSTSCDVFLPSPNGFVQITTVRHEVFKSVLSDLIWSAIGLSGQLLELLFESGGELDGHEVRVGGGWRVGQEVCHDERAVFVRCIGVIRPMRFPAKCGL